MTQNGEDGILQQLLSELELTSGLVVEFGAWDGVYLSNTFNLWFWHGFNALLIEADQAKCDELISYELSNVDVKGRFIRNGSDVDNIIQESRFGSENLVLLSIDIDGDDYHIFETLSSTFAVVIIETRTTDSVEFAMSDYHPRNYGASLYALARLGERKGYTTVCNTGNLILVRNDLVSKLKSHVPMHIERFAMMNSDVDRLQSINKMGVMTNEIQYLTIEYKRRHAQYLATLRNRR